MEKIRSFDRTTARWVFASTFLFGLAAHAFRYFNMGVSHDSLYILQNEASWQISLGRFLQPVYLLLRGKLCAPALIGLFSLVFLSLAACLIISVTGMKNRLAIVLTCGVLATNATLTLTNATYIASADIFMLSLLFSVLAVAILRKYKFGFLFGAIPLCLSLGLYQSYIEVAVMLILILLVRDCFRAFTPKDVVLRGLKALAMLALGLALYGLCMRLSLALGGVSLATTYNGISGVGNFSDVSMLELLRETYVGPFKSMLSLTTFRPVLSMYLSVAVVLVAGAGLVRHAIVRRLPVWNIVLSALFLLLMPFALNIIYFISKGMKHALMMYSFYFIYVFVILILDEYMSENDFHLPRIRGFSHRSALIPLAENFVVLAMAFLLLNNIIFSNQLYLKKELEYDATLFTITRIVDRIEQTDGYVPDETRVVIVGNLNQSELSMRRPGFDNLRALGAENNYAVTYIGTYASLFKYVLGYPINLVTDESLIDSYADMEDVQAIPAFPAAGCCVLIDGVLIVKLS